MSSPSPPAAGAVRLRVRVLDDWVPLGTFGYGDLEEYARNGVNGYCNFSRSAESELDRQVTLHMRGVTTVTDHAPQGFELATRGSSLLPAG